MTESTHLTVAFILLLLLGVMSMIGVFVTSPALAIFAIVFLAGAVAVAYDLLNVGLGEARFYRDEQ